MPNVNISTHQPHQESMKIAVGLFSRIKYIYRISSTCASSFQSLFLKEQLSPSWLITMKRQLASCQGIKRIFQAISSSSPRIATTHRTAQSAGPYLAPQHKHHLIIFLLYTKHACWRTLPAYRALSYFRSKCVHFLQRLYYCLGMCRIVMVISVFN